MFSSSYDDESETGGEKEREKVIRLHEGQFEIVKKVVNIINYRSKNMHLIKHAHIKAIALAKLKSHGISEEQIISFGNTLQ